MIRKWDDPILKTVCADVQPGEDTRDLRKLMETDCRENKGVGIAAPQVGVAKRIVFILANGGRGRFLINPRIIGHSEAKFPGTEGCLSYPGVFKEVERWASVTVAYTGVDGSAREQKFYAYEARVVQHEIDHLDGICQVGDSTQRAA